MIVDAADRPRIATAPTVEQPGPGPSSRSWLSRPALVPLWGAVGLAVVAYSFWRSLSNDDGSTTDVLFWLGYAIVVVPAAAHLAAASTSRTERVVLILYLALATYAIKVFHDPARFTFADEFTQFSVAENIQESGRLFGQLALAGSSLAHQYPGLQSVTTSLSDISGLPLFVSGLTVVGAARVVLLIGLFLLFERVGGSSRLAGLAAVLYLASPNFLFFTAQFSYESLSLPLFVAALAAASVLIRPGPPRRLTAETEARRTETLSVVGGTRVAFALAAILLTLAVVVTHHLTSYALAATFLTLGLMGLRRSWRATRALSLAVLSVGAAAAWVTFVAKDTGYYLGYVAQRTYDAVTAQGSSSARAPFESSSGPQTPVAERIVALSAVALLALILLVALLQRIRRVRTLSAPVVLLTLAGIGFVAAVPLKVFPGAWESANRSADFLFIGASFLLGGVLLGYLKRKPRPGRHLVVVGVFTVLACGGIIQGWPYAVRLPQPQVIDAAGVTVRSPTNAVVHWTNTYLGVNSPYLGDEVSGRELVVAGARRVFAPRTLRTPEIFDTPSLAPWELGALTRRSVQYVISDRRRVSADNLAGYYLQPSDEPDGGYGLYPSATRKKWERLPRASIVYDSGDVIVTDISGLLRPPPDCRSVAPRTWTEGLTCRSEKRLVRYAASGENAPLGGLRVRLNGVSTETRVTGLYVTIRVVFVNASQKRAVTVDPGAARYAFGVGRTRIDRTAPDSGRRDALRPEARIGPGRQIERSLTFVLGPGAARTFERRGGRLSLPQAGATGDQLSQVKFRVSSRGLG